LKKDIALEVKNFTKKISNNTIIDNLSLKVYKGEVFGFLGPNGAGKTTTIKSIVGLSSLTSGKILINGIDVQTDFENAIRHVGAIVENPAFYPNLSGWNNLKIFSALYNDVTKDRLNEVVEFVGLKGKMRNKVKIYSLGMKQRLGIAIALVHKPSLIILDEPTNGLDPTGIHELRTYLKNLARKENVAIVISSHILSEMELLCDRIAIINKGKLVKIKSLLEESNMDYGQHVQFEVDMNDDLVNVLKKNITDSDIIDIGASSFTIKIDKSMIPLINKELAKHDINVYSINTVKKTLESEYIEIVEV